MTDDRKPVFVKHPLRAEQRPKHVYTYYVSGNGRFPFDMLRHDGAWPANGSADFTGRENRSIELLSYREPTVNRWRSFLWVVSAERLF